MSAVDLRYFNRVLSTSDVMLPLGKAEPRAVGIIFRGVRPLDGECR